MKKIRLSHSATEKMLTCGALYKYHYIDRLRPIIVDSPLFFGAAFDDATGRMLLEKKENLTQKEKELMEHSPLEVFNQSLSEFKYNREILGPDSKKRRYSNSDLDLSLLTEDQLSELELTPEKAEEFYEHVKTRRKLKSGLSDSDTELYNKLAYLSLLEKGKMLLESFREEIMPQVLKVHSIQEKISLDNEEGDELYGFIDVILEFVDEPGVLYVADVKTSAKKYKQDSVRTSPQLTTYCEYKEIPRGAYIVAEKNIRKRDPRTRLYIVKDTIPESIRDETFDNYDKALYNIKNNHFDKNFDSGCYFYGKRCVYFDYCKKGKKDNLIQLEKRNVKQQNKS